MVIFYFLCIYVLTVFMGYVFWVCFSLPLISKIIIGFCFLYIVYSLCETLISFIFFLFKRKKVLPEVKDILVKGIPENVKVAMFRPIFANTALEMENLLQSMEKDIENNIDDLGSLKFLVIDNTRNDNVKEYTKARIKEIQQKYGQGQVFYFHRNVECDFFKKLGIYEDAILFLYEGATRPSHYIDEKWEKWAGGTRNPQKPLWDIILGDIKELGIKTEVSDILAGKDIEVDKEKRIKVAFVSDADNVWPKNEIRHMVSKILHPENKDFVIWQPEIKVHPPFANLYTKISVLMREAIEFIPKLRWRLFNFSPFYGKGAMSVSGYVKDVIKAEALHPGKSASHDFQETLFTDCCRVEDCEIGEGIFSNKISEIKRVAQWRWGDMETVRQFLFRSFSIGRKKHLFLLLRGLIEPIILDVFIVSISICIIFNCIKVKNWWGGYPFLFLWIFPYFLKKQGPLLFLNSLFLGAIDLTYMPQATIKNFIFQIKGKKYTWKTGAMGEIETRGMNLLKVYSALKNVFIIGIVFLFFSHFWIFFLIPCVIFLLAPFVVWFISKREEDG